MVREHLRNITDSLYLVNWMVMFVDFQHEVVALPFSLPLLCLTLGSFSFGRFCNCMGYLYVSCISMESIGALF